MEAVQTQNDNTLQFWTDMIDSGEIKNLSSTEITLFMNDPQKFNLDFLEKNIDYKWNFILLTQNELIPFTFILKHLDKPWCFQEASKKRDLDKNFVLKNTHLNWDWDEITINPQITYQDITSNRKLNWSLGRMLQNPNILEDLEKTPDKFDFELSTNFWYIGLNPKITVDILNKHKDKHINWEYASKNENIKMEDFLKYPDLPWKYKYLHNYS